MTSTTLSDLARALHYLPFSFFYRITDLFVREIIVCILICGFLAPAATRTQLPARAAGVSSGQKNQRPFPVTAGALKSVLSGTSDIYVTKLNTTGTALIYSSYLGGSGDEFVSQSAPSLALDSCGYVYVTGTTSSSDFPVTANGYQTFFQGIEDIFVAKLNKEGSVLIYSTYLGGSDDE